MSIIDISVTLNKETPSWPGSRGFRQEWVKRISRGDASNDSVINCDAHLGTHVDAPFHFIEGGSTVESMPLDVLCGRAFVAQLGDVGSIGGKELEAATIPPGTERLLLKTGNSKFWKESEFHPAFAALTEDGARRLVNSGIKLVGIDYLSVGPFPDGREVHRILLGADTVIIEGLDLSRVHSGWYKLVCLPLKVAGAEGIPARAILIPIEDKVL
jgi:arylformamidase